MKRDPLLKHDSSFVDKAPAVALKETARLVAPGVADWLYNAPRWLPTSHAQTIVPALFGRKPAPTPAPQPVAVEPEPEPVAEPEPEPEEPAEQAQAFGTIEWEVPEPPAAEEPDPEPVAAVDPEAVLHGVLDTLGAAHHRPFSRS